MIDKVKKSGGIDTKLPIVNEGSTYLQHETRLMAHEQRVAEQNGHHNQWGVKVNARDFVEDKPGYSEDLNNDIPEHPLFQNRQDMDGVDQNISAIPQNNPDALNDYNDALTEQLRLRKELQNKLENDNTPTYSATPRPYPR